MASGRFPLLTQARHERPAVAADDAATGSARFAGKRWWAAGGGGRWMVWTAPLLAAAAAVGAPFADEDTPVDLLGSLRAALRGFGAVRWQFVPILAGLALGHYVLAATALRAAAGRWLPLGEAIMAQLAATAANRITPLGLGGAAVNIRSLTRRGPDLPGAVAAVASLAILGALADVLLRAAILIARQLSPHRPALLVLPRARLTHVLPRSPRRRCPSVSSPRPCWGAQPGRECAARRGGRR